MLCLFTLWLELAGALPFVTTWRTTLADEVIVLASIDIVTDVEISWGDGTTSNITGQTSAVLNHTYASPGSHNVSVEGQIFWHSADVLTTKEKLVDISDWGDGFLVQTDTSLFEGYPNLQVSASPDTQPVFLPGASLSGMFRTSSFNSSLNWDLTNVTSLQGMFASTPLNQPITFRNTQGVQSIAELFYSTPFNQPFHFDASGVTIATLMFYKASSFNQVVNLTNSSLLANTVSMFAHANSFNQPIIFNTSSVIFMSSMFLNATKFNQPITFDTSQVLDMASMFSEAESFNQPINLNTPNLIGAASMFSGARSFNQPVEMNTSNVATMSEMFRNAANFSSTVTFTSTAKVTYMGSMFDGVDEFTQDLSSWDTQLVVRCATFCPWCGLPAFPSCSFPCPVMRYTVGQVSVCNTRAPTSSMSPSSSPSSSPTTLAPSSTPSSSPTTMAPSTAVPTTAAPSNSAAPSPAPSVAPSTNPSAAPSVPSVSAAIPATAPTLALAVFVLLASPMAAFKL